MSETQEMCSMWGCKSWRECPSQRVGTEFPFPPMSARNRHGTLLDRMRLSDNKVSSPTNTNVQVLS